LPDGSVDTVVSTFTLCTIPGVADATKTKLTAVRMLALTGAFAAVAQQRSLTGVVTDSMCGAAHMAKDKIPAECV
jgi:hypothetical protein